MYMYLYCISKTVNWTSHWICICLMLWNEVSDIHSQIMEYGTNNSILLANDSVLKHRDRFWWPRKCSRIKWRTRQKKISPTSKLLRHAFSYANLDSNKFFDQMASLCLVIGSRLIVRRIKCWMNESLVMCSYSKCLKVKCLVISQMFFLCLIFINIAVFLKKIDII